MLMTFAFGATAQNRKIDFLDTKVWKEIVDKAKAENKLIFVDCYTDWCGPCKMLSANVFTQDEVADFFNQNFVNAKFEMEKDADGVARKDTWGIKAYPTLIFVDPKTEEVVHRLVGAGKADWLIDGGKTAMDPSKNLNSMIERYNKGDRDPLFLGEYLDALQSAYMQDEQAKVATEYLENLTADQLATTENWTLLSKNVNDPLAKPMKLVVANIQKFYNIPGQEQRQAVDRLVNGSIISAAAQLAQWQPGRGGEFNQQRFDELVSYLNTIDLPVKEQALAWLNTSVLSRKGDWKAMLAEMRKVEKEGKMGRQFGQYYQFFIESLGRLNDKAAVEEGVKWLNEKIKATTGEDTNAFFAKASYADSKSRLYNSIGDAAAAENAKKESEEYAKEGQAASGGRVQQAIRMQ